MKRIINAFIMASLSLLFISCTSDDVSDMNSGELEIQYSQLLTELKENGEVSATTSDSQISELNTKISKLNQMGRRLRSIDNEKYGQLVFDGEMVVINLRTEIRLAKEIKLASEVINLQFSEIKNRSEELETSGLDTTQLTMDEKINKKNMAQKIIDLADEYDEISTENNPCESLQCDEDFIEQLSKQKQFIETKRELSIALKSQIEADTITQ